MKMYLISDNIDTWTGMRLAGVEGAVVHEKAELKQELDKVLVAAFREAGREGTIIGGRYGLGSKDTPPSSVFAV